MRHLLEPYLDRIDALIGPVEQVIADDNELRLDIDDIVIPDPDNGGWTLPAQPTRSTRWTGWSRRWRC
jgi:hypothetical protein